MDRFTEEFSEAVDSEDEDEGGKGEGEGEGGGGRKKLAKEGAAAAGRPSDHEALLAGNSDDHFRLGIKLTK